MDRIEKLKNKAASLPLSPGVYIMKNADNEIIYVGKAKALKNRVSQYFGLGNQHTPKVKKMVSNVQDFDYIICDSEFEALILEASLIKQNQPKYNILLKDDKGYFYIKITNEKWRRIRAEKQVTNDNAEYLGPYYSIFVVNQTVDEANKVFKLPTCNRNLGAGKTKPCLNYHIGLCSAPCAGKIGYNEYDECVKSAVSFVKGDTASALSRLNEQMKNSAERLDFELAARIRDRITAIKKLNDKQKIYASKFDTQDVIALVRGDSRYCICVFNFRDGRMSDCNHFVFNSDCGEDEARYEFIERYYSDGRTVPPEIVLDVLPPDSELLRRWLSELRGGAVHISAPQKGERMHLAEMCRNNAMEYLLKNFTKDSKNDALEELKKLLNLDTPPKYIESYDISHTAGSENVAGMVVFCDGKPYRSAYKRFKIKSFSGQDDYGSMREVLTRRFNEYLSHKDDNSGFGKLPDLILIDGGTGQLSAAKEAADALNIDVAMFGMVKDNKHRTRAIAAKGGDVEIKSNRSVYTLISSIQEETHRFAISYHRTRSRKTALQSNLTKIDGVGKVTAEILLKHFKTVSALRDATTEELNSISGINRPTAEKIYRYFHNENTD